MPLASFAMLLPVQGATSTRSSSFFGPMGSTCTMESITQCPVSAQSRCCSSAAFIKRVSNRAALKDRIGYRSAPSAFIRSSIASTGAKVQKEPVMAQPMRAPASRSRFIWTPPSQSAISFSTNSRITCAAASGQ